MLYARLLLLLFFMMAELSFSEQVNAQTLAPPCGGCFILSCRAAGHTLSPDMNLSPYRSAVILPLQDAAAARAVNHLLFAYWRAFAARYCFPAFAVQAYVLRSLGAWAPQGALMLCAPADELTPESCRRLRFDSELAVFQTPWADSPLSCLYYLRMPQGEVLRQQAEQEAVPFSAEEGRGFIAALRAARSRALAPMRHYRDDVNCIAVFPLRSHETADNRRRNLSLFYQLEWVRKIHLATLPLSVLWVASIPGEMAPFGAVVFLTHGDRKHPMPLNRETLKPLIERAQEQETARGIYFLQRDREHPETFRIADTLPICGLCPPQEPVPNLPKLLAEGLPHRYLCTLHTPYFAKPRLRFQAYRPWQELDAHSERYSCLFSAGPAV